MMKSIKRKTKLGVVVPDEAKQSEPPVPEVNDATSEDGVSKVSKIDCRLGKSKMKWTHQNNKILWDCYIRSEPLMRGYMQRMYDLWVN